MQKIFILTINGTIYVFNRENINDDMITKLKMCAKTITEKNLEFKTNEEACKYFMYQVEKELEIILQEVSVTDIIRINININ